MLSKESLTQALLDDGKVDVYRLDVDNYTTEVATWPYAFLEQASAAKMTHWRSLVELNQKVVMQTFTTDNVSFTTMQSPIAPLLSFDSSTRTKGDLVYL